MKIRRIFATNTLPTIEVELKTKDGTVTSAVPMGTSTGKHEAMSLPVDEAIRKFAMASRYFRTNEFYSIDEVDRTLHTIDVTSNFSEIGGNVALGISSAFLKAFALHEDLEVFEYLCVKMKQKPKMPMPLCNVVGGRHGKSGSTQSNIQEFLLLPVSQRSFSASISKMTEAYRTIGEQLDKEDEDFSYGDNIESAWVTNLESNKILDILSRVAGQNLFKMGIDAAASNLWNGKNYVYTRRDIRGNVVEENLIRTEQLNFIEDLIRRFPGIKYVEDPFEEDDFILHATLNHRLTAQGKGVLVCGDDLYATNPKRLETGISNKSTNAVIVKPNQIGTITDTIKFAELAKKSGMRTVMSHRSGETEDTLICHLAVGIGCDYTKFGIAGERTTKINEMLRIEEKMI